MLIVVSRSLTTTTISFVCFASSILCSVFIFFIFHFTFSIPLPSVSWTHVFVSLAILYTFYIFYFFVFSLFFFHSFNWINKKKVEKIRIIIQVLVEHVIKFFLFWQFSILFNFKKKKKKSHIVWTEPKVHSNIVMGRIERNEMN